MKITKFAHACIAIDDAGETLLVDPGGYSPDLVIADTIVAVVITHEHGDHLDRERLQQIVTANPEAIIVCHQDIATQLQEFTTHSVETGQIITIGNFTLEFFGGEHAFIYDNKPHIANLGVMINNRLYYPGDSFALPGREVEILALPVSAPWMKISEAVEFARQVNPHMMFPTHDAILSDIGRSMVDRLIPEAIGAETKYQRLLEPLEV